MSVRGISGRIFVVREAEGVALQYGIQVDHPKKNNEHNKRGTKALIKSWMGHMGCGTSAQGGSTRLD